MVRFAVLFVLTFGFVVMQGSAAPAVAKGLPDLISISRYDYFTPREISAEGLPFEMSPWSDDFLGKKVEGVPAVNPNSYLISLYERDERGNLREIYRLWYHRDTLEGRDFIKIPNADEPGFSLNQYTIIRPTGFYEVTPTWIAFMNQYTGVVRPPATGDGGLLGR